MLPVISLSFLGEVKVKSAESVFGLASCAAARIVARTKKTHIEKDFRTLAVTIISYLRAQPARIANVVPLV
jgi:hypothetical protein